MTAMHASFVLEILPECLRSGTRETRAFVSAKSRLLNSARKKKQGQVSTAAKTPNVWSKNPESLDAFEVRRKIWQTSN